MFHCFVKMESVKFSQRQRCKALRLVFRIFYTLTYNIPVCPRCPLIKHMVYAIVQPVSGTVIYKMRKEEKCPGVFSLCPAFIILLYWIFDICSSIGFPHPRRGVGIIFAYLYIGAIIWVCTMQSKKRKGCRCI
jgi:hypothetical protein